MGKIDTYTKNRIEGLAWALSLIDKQENPEKGIEMLRKEVAFRRATFIPLEIPDWRITSCSALLTKRLMNTLLIVWLKIFEEEFNWKKVRLQRMVQLFSKHSLAFFDIDPYGDRYVKMSDYAKYFREEYEIGFTDEDLDELIGIEEKNDDKRLRRVQFDVIEKHLKNGYPEALEYLKKQLGDKVC